MKFFLLTAQIFVLTIWIGPYQPDSTKTTNPKVVNKPSVGEDFLMQPKVAETKATNKTPQVAPKSNLEPEVYPIGGFLGALLFEPHFLSTKTEEGS